MDEHRKAVETIAARVAEFSAIKTPFRIYHGSTNLTRETHFRRDAMIDTSSLSHVLHIDRESMTALVEPNVPMDHLVDATLQVGLIPPVVMEFPGITAGGGFAGTSGESSSFRHGFFHHTVNWIELVMANGEIVRASNTQNQELFHAASASFGTFGVTTLLELQLIEAKKYVQVTYHPVSSVTDAVKKIEQATDDPSNDYLDGILFSHNFGVICTGRLIDVLPDDTTKVQSFHRATDPWFYLHAKAAAANGRGASKPITEAIPLVDYLFRYDRGCFWVGKYAFQYFMTPFNRITRWALDRFMHTRVMYHAFHQSGHTKRYILQDVAVPYQTAEDLLSFVEETFNLFPLWLCPLRQTGKYPGSAYGLTAETKRKPDAPEMLLNFGVWGPGPKGRDNFIAVNRRLEQKVHELKGQKWLYAQTYYTETEFWEIYDREEYNALREKYHAAYLPNLYDKVKGDPYPDQRTPNWMGWVVALIWSIWPLSGLYGVLQTIVGREYLLPRRSLSWDAKDKNE